jgi:hypothetical protein
MVAMCVKAKTSAFGMMLEKFARKLEQYDLSNRY